MVGGICDVNVTKRNTFEIERKNFIKCAVEVWRLRNQIEPIKEKQFTVIRHSILNLFYLFEKEGISFVELKNQAYDAGMALEVIDIEENSQLPKGSVTIKEVIEPLVLLNGQVINQGQVILEKGTLEDVPMLIHEE